MMETACSASESKETLLYSHLINTIGAAYFESNNLKKCRIHFENARDLRERLLPENDLQVAVSLANLGNVETAEGLYDEAQILLEEAARIRELQKEPLMLGLSFLQLGRVWFLRNEFDHARQMYSKADACFAKRGAEDPLYMANLNYAYGNLELEKALLSRQVSSTEGYEQALRYYIQVKEACDAHAPFHQLAAANFYKMACTEFSLNHPGKALAYLEKAFNVAEIRSSGEVDGTIARIWFKKSEILIDDDIRREEGIQLRKEVTAHHENIVDALGLTFDADELFTDKAFDILVPGYFR
jgi:tetratricopeptide (TPR) repeat protein